MLVNLVQQIQEPAHVLTSITVSSDHHLPLHHHYLIIIITNNNKNKQEKKGKKAVFDQVANLSLHSYRK